MNVPRTCLIIFALGLALLPGTIAQAQVASSDLPTYDIRLADPATKQQSAETLRLSNVQASRVAAQKLIEADPTLSITFDETLGTPSFVRSTSHYLTDPASPEDWYQSLSTYVTAHQTLFMVPSSMLSDTRVTRDYTTRHNGVRHVTLQQTLNGIDIIGAELRANFTRNGELINISSTLLPLATKRADNVTVSPEDAVRTAASNIGASITAPLKKKYAAEDQWIRFSDTGDFLGTPMTKRMYFPMSRDLVRPVWVTVLPELGTANVYEITVDALDSSVLYRRNRTNYQSENSSYRVYTSDSPSPFSPGSATPDGFQPPTVSRTLSTLIHTMPWPLPWAG